MANTYTTNNEVRNEAGFDYNTDITDSQIEAARLRASGVINSQIGSRYKLPLSDNACWSTSPAKDLVKNIELMLASAYLLIKEYWSEGLDTDKDGYKKKNLAEEQLRDIVNGTIKLICLDGNELTGNTWSAKKLRPSSYPGTWEGRKFTVGMEF